MSLKIDKQIKKMPQCKEMDCKNLSIDDNDGYCLSHICPPPIPLVLQHLNEIKEKRRKNNDTTPRI